MAVPESLVLTFFEDARKALEECKVQKESTSISDHRKFLLDLQRSCLERVVADYCSDTSQTLSVHQVQQELRNLNSASNQVKLAMESMNDAARLALCRLVLYSECLLEDRTNRVLHKTGPIPRPELLEFCGLCKVSLRLDNVQKHLETGEPLFDDIPKLNPPIFPQKRFERVQRLLMKAVGYDPDLGTQEIERIFFKREPNEFSQDREVLDLFEQVLVAMRNAIHKASVGTTAAAFSDQHEGGVTRVVSVNFSEKTVDPSQEHNILDSVQQGPTPRSETMEDHAVDQQRQQLLMARRAVELQQEILQELMSMSEEERNRTLQSARQASQDFVEHIMKFPSGPERVAALQNVDSSTQRLLAMHKLWESTLAANGGKPPTLEQNL